MYEILGKNLNAYVHIYLHTYIHKHNIAGFFEMYTFHEMS